MATTNLSYGSSGDEVKKLQQSLINAGYDLGNGGADGIFGEKTQAAVKKYQQDNGLAVDGIAGTNTLGKLFSTENTASGGSTSTAQTPAPAAPDYSKYSYDASADEAYQQALSALQQAAQSAPTYAGTYDSQLNDLYEQIVNRDKFKYDLNSDMLYQQYKDQYVNMGQMAMKDTMGQAAALTGGYGSSYAQGVGQQQYDAYLQQLNDVVPELYGMAYNQYQDEGNAMLQQYAMVGDMADDEYGKYQDSLNQYWQNVDYLKGQADDAYDKGYTNWYNSYQMGVDAQNSAYKQLTDMMASSGYKPTAGELAAAGMTQGQADSYLNAWKAANPDIAYHTGAITPDEYYKYTGKYPIGYAPASSGGGYGGGGGGDYTGGGAPDWWKDMTPEERKAYQETIGADPDGLWGPETAGKGGLEDPNAGATGFTGTTYSEAVAYMQSNGVSNGVASGAMTKSEWQGRKNAGSGNAAVKNYDNYTDYLRDYVEYQTSKK